jgi:hypothetical protein
MHGRKSINFTVFINTHYSKVLTGFRKGYLKEENRRRLGIPKHRWEVNIKIIYK